MRGIAASCATRVRLNVTGAPIHRAASMPHAEVVGFPLAFASCVRKYHKKTQKTSYFAYKVNIEFNSRHFYEIDPKNNCFIRKSANSAGQEAGNYGWLGQSH